MNAGAAIEKLEDLPNYRTSSHYSPRERAAMELADHMTRSDLDVSETLFQKAQAEFSTQELVELVAVIALENFRSKFNNAFRIESQGFCAVPQAER